MVMTFFRIALPGLAFAAALSAVPALAQNETTFEVETSTVTDLKAVYATVESLDVISARARIGGTVVTLDADEGDRVEAGAVLAVIVDDRLAPQVRALDAQVTAIESSLRQAQAELSRVRQLFERGVVAQARLDEAVTAVDVVQGQLDAAMQERSVVIQQQREGEVLAPTGGVVLDVSVTEGTVVFAGDPVVNVASETYVLRLRLPERHARYLSEGAEILIDQSALGGEVAPSGTIRQVYPQIADGRVIADADVEGLGGFFVGERVRVWVPAGERDAILVPETYLHTRYGIDYVTLQSEDGYARDMTVQRGRGHEGAFVEILSGLAAGDVIVQP